MQVKIEEDRQYLFVSGLVSRVNYIFSVRATTRVGEGPETTGDITTGPRIGMCDIDFILEPYNIVVLCSNFIILVPLRGSTRGQLRPKIGLNNIDSILEPYKVVIT